MIFISVNDIYEQARRLFVSQDAFELMKLLEEKK